MKKVLISGVVLALCTTGVFAAEQDSQHEQQEEQEMSQSEMSQVSVNQLSSDKIEMIQQNLNSKGFDAGSVDGVFGKNTRNALTNFQKAQNLEVTGELNQETLSALGVSIEGEAQAQEAGNGQMEQGPAEVQDTEIQQEEYDDSLEQQDMGMEEEEEKQY